VQEKGKAGLGRGRGPFRFGGNAEGGKREEHMKGVVRGKCNGGDPESGDVDWGEGKKLKRSSWRGLTNQNKADTYRVMTKMEQFANRNGIG